LASRFAANGSSQTANKSSPPTSLQKERFFAQASDGTRYFTPFRMTALFLCSATSSGLHSAGSVQNSRAGVGPAFRGGPFKGNTRNAFTQPYFSVLRSCVLYSFRALQSKVPQCSACISLWIHRLRREVPYWHHARTEPVQYCTVRHFALFPVPSRTYAIRTEKQGGGEGNHILNTKVLLEVGDWHPPGNCAGPAAMME
jgi:hypothetical protein